MGDISKFNKRQSWGPTLVCLAMLLNVMNTSLAPLLRWVGVGLCVVSLVIINIWYMKVYDIVKGLQGKINQGEMI